MFENIHSSFPDRKGSSEYPIFSEMKSSLKPVVGSSSNSWKAWSPLNAITLHFPIENFLQSTQSSLKWSLLWNPWSSSNSWKAWSPLKKFTLHFPVENVLQSTQTSLKWSLLWNLLSSSNSWKAWSPLKTFTLHLPNENILHSKQSSLKWSIPLKWSLLWNSWSSSNSLKAWLALNTHCWEIVTVYFWQLVLSEFPDLICLRPWTCSRWRSVPISWPDGLQPLTCSIWRSVERISGPDRTRFWLWTLRRRGRHQACRQGGCKGCARTPPPHHRQLRSSFLLMRSTFLLMRSTFLLKNGFRLRTLEFGIFSPPKMYRAAITFHQYATLLDTT